MGKCHCSGVKFEEIVKFTQINKCDYEEAAQALDAGETCTACKPDLTEYCEKNLGLEK
jgi:bacterioferritin-associated ferredoxin